MITIGWFKDNVLADAMSASHTWSEILELWEALWEGNADHVVEEWNDVMLCSLLLLSRWVPLRWMYVYPGFGHASVEKFLKRNETWADIFVHHGAVFHPRFTVGGSNFRKRYKVVRVLGNGGVEEADIDWDVVRDMVGGFEV